MRAHYIRRILGGLLTLWLGSFILYNMGVYLLIHQRYLHPPSPRSVYTSEIQHYELQHPWPLNYGNWLFDPMEPDKSYSILVGRTVVERMPPYLDVQVGPARLRGSGLLTGDLGLSGMVDRGVPVVDVIGSSSVPLSLALLICTNALLMAASVVQRKGRKPVFGAASGPLAAVARIEATYRYARAAT
jgi:ABC-type dipeptide/oligopeptide/nickel transport system permease component